MQNREHPAPLRVSLRPGGVTSPLHRMGLHLYPSLGALAALRNGPFNQGQESSSFPNCERQSWTIRVVEYRGWRVQEQKEEVEIAGVLRKGGKGRPCWQQKQLLSQG